MIVINLYFQTYIKKEKLREIFQFAKKELAGIIIPIIFERSTISRRTFSWRVVYEKAALKCVLPTIER